MKVVFFSRRDSNGGQELPQSLCCTGVLIILSCTASQKSTKEGLPFVEK